MPLRQRPRRAAGGDRHERWAVGNHEATPRTHSVTQVAVLWQRAGHTLYLPGSRNM